MLNCEPEILLKIKNFIFTYLYPLRTIYIYGSNVSSNLYFEQKEWSLEMLGNGYILLGFFSIIGLLIGGPLIDKLDTKKTAITVLPLSLSVIVLLLFDSVFF